MANPDIGPLWKPPKGSFRTARLGRRAEALAAETRAKAEVRQRDRTCRWPQCDCQRQRPRRPLECAHLLDKSLGGPSTADNMVLICDLRHRLGTPSLHGKDLRIVPQTDDGANGLLDFEVRDPETGRFELVAAERYVGVPEMRGR